MPKRSKEYCQETISDILKELFEFVKNESRTVTYGEMRDHLNIHSGENVEFRTNELNAAFKKELDKAIKNTTKIENLLKDFKINCVIP